MSDQGKVGGEFKMGDTEVKIEIPTGPDTENKEDGKYVFELPLRSGVRRLVTSTKALVCLAALGGAVALHVLGRIDADRLLSFVQWIVAFYVGGVVLEDAAEKLRDGGSKLFSTGSLDKFRDWVRLYFPHFMAQLLPVLAARYQQPERTSGMYRAYPRTCRYTVQKDDPSLEQIMRDALPGIQDEQVQKAVAQLAVLNESKKWEPGQSWKLPDWICAHMLKLHPDLEDEPTKH